MTTVVNQRLTGSAVTSLAGGGPGTLHIDLCYQNNTNPGALTNFSGGNWIVHQITGPNTRLPFSATGSVLPGAGTWRVGMCVRTNTVSIGPNDYINGWVQVTN